MIKISLGDVIVAARVPGMASGNALNAQPAALESSVFDNGLAGVF